MAFDEYEYLEKTVEDPTLIDSDKKSEKSDRKRNDDDEEEEEERRKSKKSRSEEENGKERHRSERDRDMERVSEREKERKRKEREREREKERDRSSSRRRESSRERSSSRRRESSRERERETRSSSRRRHDSRERERDREKERERRSSSRRRDDSRERRSSSRSRRHGSRDLEIEFRDSRRFREKKEAVEPEADPERDQRTVFAYQMPLKAMERDVYEFFSKAGKVRDVRLIMDRNSRRSKGVGYIEFYDALSVPMAIALSGQLLLGQPVMVKPSEAEKNLVQSTSAGGGSSVTGPYGPTDRKLYVGNLHFSTTEHHLRQIFEPFGPVELVQLPLDNETGQCKGFGFVQFAQAEHAKAAQILNGQVEIAGRCIKVSSVTDHVGAQDTGTTTADFDDDEGGGLALSAQSRAMLMQKLDRTGTASSIVGALGATALNGTAPVQQSTLLPTIGQGGILPGVHPTVLPAPALESIGIPSECLLLKNLFDPATETEPDFDLDIKEDVHEECSKFGEVRHIYVDRNSAGHVYLRFANKEAAVNAQRGMNARWFARRLISAIFLPPQEYEAKFRDGH